ncbi:MAG TPA: galactokinase [Tepidisphaeraceae bacterium]|nr:galactokinase [Tepidisphaeraceae bacterium]
MQTAYAPLREQFHQTFGADAPGAGRVRVVRAPGRVNLIGEHTDYNDGFVFPMAIEPQVFFICRSRPDGQVRLTSTAFPGDIVEFSVQQRIERSEPKWANYVRGVAAEMLGAGVPLVGMDVLVANTLPVGGGLSSSAAIEVGTAQAFLTLTGQQMDPGRIALLCQKAEHEYALVPCGIMDQTIVAAGRQGHAMLLDCRSLSRQYIPIDPNELRVVIVNSMVKHELSGGEYAQRRRQCEEGVAYFARTDPGVRALRDLTMSQLEQAQGKLPDVVFRRCRHVVGENARTTQAAARLGQRRYEEAGQLMVQSHASLRDDYEVSIPELDFLAEQAMKIKGVYGARMTGGGFGGCIVALAQPRSVDALIDHLNKTYEARFGIHPAAYVTTATAAAGAVE